jgi:hypothetical protein
MVRIPGKNYEMGKYDVTRGEFAKFVTETGYDAGNSCYVWTGSAWDNRSGSNWRNPGFSQDDTHPVTCVNWNDAQAYASWLSKKAGKQYRLPIEANGNTPATEVVRLNIAGGVISTVLLGIKTTAMPPRIRLDKSRRMDTVYTI